MFCMLKDWICTTPASPAGSNEIGAAGDKGIKAPNFFKITKIWLPKVQETLHKT